MLHVTEVRALAHMTECDNSAVTCTADVTAGCYSQVNNIRPTARRFWSWP